jgi:hypothetical protein
MALPVTIESSARRLFPNLPPEQAIVELLLERAQKNLIKYQTMARGYKKNIRRTSPLFARRSLLPNLIRQWNRITLIGN